MIVLNFGHPLTDDHLDAIARLTGEAVERVHDIPVQFDNGQPFAEQVEALMAAVPLGTAEWQATPLLVNLPALNVIAALVLAAIHGRAGHFPAVLRLRPAGGSVPRYEVAEILNLQALRERARAARQAGDGDAYA